RSGSRSMPTCGATTCASTSVRPSKNGSAPSHRSTLGRAEGEHLLEERAVLQQVTITDEVVDDVRDGIGAESSDLFGLLEQFCDRVAELAEVARIFEQHTCARGDLVDDAADG